MILTWLLHAIYSTTIAYVLSMVFGGLAPWIAIVSLLAGTLIGARHAKRLLAARPELKVLCFAKGEAGVIEWLLFIFITFAAWRHFTWLFYLSDLNWSTLSLNNFGDLPLHINYIRALANGISFPPSNPIFASELLRYPYGPDLYNALWEILNVRLQAHLFFTGLFATLASFVALRAFGGYWAIGAFFLSGGLAGWQVIQGSKLKDFQTGIDWKNLFLSVFITQRGMLFALPLGLLLLVFVRGHLSGAKPLARVHLLILGLLWGLMPLFHLHAFIAVSVLLALIAFEHGGLRGVLKFLTSSMALIAYVPAIWFVMFSTAFLQRTTGIVRLHWGWTSGTYPMFYLENFGPWLLVPFICAIAIYFAPSTKSDATSSEFRSEKKRLWIEFASYSLLLIVFFNVMLAPWEWDNIKVLIWPYLGFARLLYVVLEPRLGFFLGAFERPLLATVFFLSGFIVVVATLQAPIGRAAALYQVGDLAFTEGALTGVPKDSVFAASPTHQHGLTYFGRMRALGYDGHLWSHGIDATRIRDAQDKIMNDDPDFVRLAHEAGITHIFWGPEERLRYGVKPRSWMQTLQNVSKVPGYEIYAIK